MAYGDFIVLPRRTASDKILRDQAFNIAKSLKYDGYHRGLASMFYNFFDKKSAALTDKSASIGAIKNENVADQQLAEELHKPIIRKFEKLKVHSSFIDNIWGANLPDMQLISIYNKRICFLLCVIFIYSKYVRVVSLKSKKCITIIKVSQIFLDESVSKKTKYG